MKCRFIKDICLYQGYKNKFKINSVISIKINSGQAIDNFPWAISAHTALY